MWAAKVHQLFGARPRSGAFVDVAIAAATLGASLVLINHGGVPGSEADGELDWVAAVLAVGSSAPLLAWRRSPLGVFVATAAASALLAGLGYPLGVPLGPGVALYLLAASRAEESPWARRETAAVLALFAAYAGIAWVGLGSLPGSELLHAAFTWAVAWFAGERTRLRREHVAELSERAERAEREAERERRLAVAEERARIARDLHDAAGNAINVIAVRAGAARMRQDVERSQATLEAIEELARKTGGEIDQIVGTLRDRGSANGSVDVPPGLASLDTLVAGHAAAGLDISVATAGEPRQLEGATDQAAYRILQEALANASRHGAGDARVELAFGESALELIVSNEAQQRLRSAPLRSASNQAPQQRRGSAPLRSASQGGHGLIGMRERATLLGGSLDAERVNGAFRVRARLPYGGQSA